MAIIRPNCRPITIGRKGVTLIELMISATLLGMLLLLNLLIFQTGMSGWRKVDSQANLLQDLQVVGSFWVREVMGSSSLAISLSPTAVSLPSPRTETAEPANQGVLGQLSWRRYRIFYYDASTQEIWLGNQTITPPSENPQPIELVDFGSGKHPLSYYCTGGKRLATRVNLFQPSRQGNLIVLRAGGHEKRYGSEKEEDVSVQFSAAPRN